MADSGVSLHHGSGSLDLPVPMAEGRADMRLWYHLPRGFTTGSPMLFVMHGVHRNARVYRDTWVRHGETHDALIVAPEFSKVLFPGARSYNLGTLKAGAGEPRGQTAFSIIEHLFDALREIAGSRRAAYRIFGHSAGAQFVHRLVTFVPAARVERAVAANAGWYTLPDFDERFPYGLGGLSYSPDELQAALGQPLTILVGEADTDEEDPFLRKTKEAMRQGPHRYARAQNYFRSAQSAAKRLAAPCPWRLATVPNIAHDDIAIAAPAARLLFDDMPSG